MQRHGDKLLICDREILTGSDDQPMFIGKAQFLLEAKGLTIRDDISSLTGITIEDGACYKMVLKRWPIE